MQQTVR